MTVCIVALCASPLPEDQGTWIVGASDRMLSNRIMGAEPNISKIVPFTSHIVALYAGDPRFHSTVATKVNARLGLLDISKVTVDVVAQLYAQEIANERRVRAEREYLTHLGQTTFSFMTKQQNLPTEVVADLMAKLQTYEVEVETLIAGIDGTGAHIYSIDDKGIAESCNFEGFAVIGEGYIHADSEFMNAQYTNRDTFTKGLFLVYAGKRKAEVTPSVGQYTDLFYIDSSTGFNFIGEGNVRQFEKIYNGADQKQQAAWATAQQEMEEFFADLGAKAEAPKPWQEAGDEQGDVSEGSEADEPKG